MGLHQRPGFLGETSEPGQHLVGARRREPGRDDRPDQASTSVDRSDIGDRPTARVDPRDRIVISVEIRRAGRVIHRHAADERPLTLRNAGLGQDRGRLVVNRREVGRRGRAVPKQGRHQIGVHRLGNGAISEARLQRERVGEQPLVEREIECRAVLLPLWRMEVQVDEPRSQHLVVAEHPVIG